MFSTPTSRVHRRCIGYASAMRHGPPTPSSSTPFGWPPVEWNGIEWVDETTGKVRKSNYLDNSSSGLKTREHLSNNSLCFFV
eukprot:4456085-Pyramimonas_sp.AAC.1